MHAPRWLWIASTLLAVNIILVAGTSIRAHLPQDESALAEPPAIDTENTKPTLDDDTAPATPLGDPTSSPQDPPSVPDSDGLSGGPLPLPPSLAEADLPDVPSLHDMQRLQSDPVYQEIRKMFSEEGGEESNPPQSLDEPAAQSSPKHLSHQYFERLDRRLATTAQLCQSAQSLAAEAESCATEGDSVASQELLNMATQLREMAADLLVRPL